MVPQSWVSSLDRALAVFITFLSFLTCCDLHVAVVYVVLNNDVEKETLNKDELKTAMKASVKLHLNPLFGISDIVIADSLPRTASNKVMRRLVRDEYMRVYAS